MALLALIVLLAAQATGAALAADGLPPGVPVPSWAKGRWVHFEAAGTQNRPPAQSGLAGRHAGGGLSTQSGPAAMHATGSRVTLTEDSLSYYGGEVENEPRLVLVFWGKGWTSEPRLALRHELEATAEGLPGSGYQKILTQYSSIDGPISPGSSLSSPIIEKYYDTRAISTRIGAEAVYSEAMEVMHITGTGSHNTTYAVLPEPGTVEVEKGVCAFHVPLVIGGSSLAAIMDTEERAACGPVSQSLTHEYAESVTDPNGFGWGRGQAEIADVCDSLGPRRMADGAWVAALWDDSKKACEVEDSDPGSVPIGPYTEPSLERAAEQTLESETLEASLEPCDLEAHYFFEYGTSTSYGSRSAESVLPATWGNVKGDATITGLKYSTLYDWRVVVKTSNGTAYGVNHKFSIPYYVEVYSEEATGVGTTGATLNGEVEPAGAQAKYYFEYGTTEAYGSRTTEAGAGSGKGYVRASAALAGLAPGTRYHFRIVASSSRGTAVGKDRKFWTRGGKPVAEASPATSIGYTEAALNGVVNPKGVATNFYFEYGTTSAYGRQTPEQSAGEGTEENEERAFIRGLTPATTYHYRIVATNSYGTTYGSDQTFATGQEPLVETDAPETVGYNDATLSGGINPHGTETGYYFEYGTTQAYGERTAQATAGSGTNNAQEIQTVNGLAEDATYHFRIVATNSYGTTYGADQTFSTGTQPFVQTNAPASVASTGATLSGTINPHGTEVAYYFEYGVTPEYGSSTAQTTAGSGGSDVDASQTIAELSPGTTYHYRLVTMYDSIKQYGSEVTFTTTPLAPLAQAIGPAPFPNETPPPPAPHKTPPPPLVQNARQSAKRWREGSELAHISHNKTPTGTTFSVSLNEQAILSFGFTELLGGSPGGHSCLTKTNEHGQRQSCNHTVTRETLSFSGHSGINKVVFAGRISRTNKLKPGRYALVITATNSTGQRSAPVSLSFTIAR